MNTPVSLEIEKLLIEKDIDMPVSPTISDVVMWLYEKHGIWIRVTPKPYSHFLTHWRWEHMSTDYSTRNCGWERTEDYLLPTEAYEAAIIFCLEQII